MARVRVVHWYHFFCGHEVVSLWDDPLAEHVAALRSAEFEGECRIGLVGGAVQQSDAVRWLAVHWPEAQVAVTAEEGFEQVTLAALHEWSRTADPTTPVLYCHTKGAFSNHPVNPPWRQAMTAACVTQWRHRVADLETADAVGLHWLTPEAFPAYVSTPFFGGNFWLARTGYLAGLKSLQADDTNRYKAESWIGTGSPRVKALSETWPDYAYSR